MKKVETETINALIIEPMKAPYVKEIGTKLEDFQKEVGGSIEVVYPFDELVELICNEEGKFNGMLPNRALCDSTGNVYDIIFGKFIIVGLNEDMDMSISLSEDLISLLSKKFEKPERFAFINGKIKAIPIEPTM